MRRRSVAGDGRNPRSRGQECISNVPHVTVAAGRSGDGRGIFDTDETSCATMTSTSEAEADQQQAMAAVSRDQTWKEEQVIKIEVPNGDAEEVGQSCYWPHRGPETDDCKPRSSACGPWASRRSCEACGRAFSVWTWGRDEVQRGEVEKTRHKVAGPRGDWLRQGKSR